MTFREALAAAAARLGAAGVPGAARDARLLVAEAAGLAPDRLTLALGDAWPRDAEARLAPMVEARCRRRPVAQILGRRRFWGRDFRVTGDVLDPRPETESLVALALAPALAGPRPGRVLDLGTGSGAILLTLLAEWPTATGVGIDASAPALEVARGNATALGLGDRAALRLGDWLEGITERFDLVVCNPPYIAADEMPGLSRDVRDWEPAAALTPGGDGLDAYRRIAVGLGAVLSPGGRALFEIGAGQGVSVPALFRAAGFARISVHPDLEGRDRVVAVA